MNSKEKNTLLEVKELKTYFYNEEGTVKAADGVNFSIKEGNTLCLVGESGCGKSVTARSILQLINKPGEIISGEINFLLQNNKIIDIAELEPTGKKIRNIRGKQIAMIFQEPMTSLSPLHTIGNQIIETILLHAELNKRETKERAIEALRHVNIPKPEERLNAYPFELSGGMRQRVMIAMALACRPKLLIADEPTTALDVTTQANILNLIDQLQDEFSMSVLFITHDLGVVAEIADEVAVMYLGKIVEFGNVFSIFEDPKHPYTKALIQSIPKLETLEKQELFSIKGMVPHPLNRPSGCSFNTRCEHVIPELCKKEIPPDIKINNRRVRCFLYNRDNSRKEQLEI